MLEKEHECHFMDEKRLGETHLKPADEGFDLGGEESEASRRG